MHGHLRFLKLGRGRGSANQHLTSRPPFFFKKSKGILPDSWAGQQKGRRKNGGLKKVRRCAASWELAGAHLFLPRTLFVAIRLQALSALMLVHLQTTFLFQVSHGVEV